MKLAKLAPAALLFAGLLSPALADEYQDVIDKVFPGYHILGPSEIKLDKEKMNQEIYYKVKDHPGLIVGKINSDNVMDFAALIRDSKKKAFVSKSRGKPDRKFDYYNGYLVVCYGLGAGKYKCEKLDANPLRMGIPTDYFLEKISPGEQSCEGTQKFRPPRPPVDPNLGFDPDAEPSTGIASISFTTDAIGLRSYGQASNYVYQPGGMYLECGLTG